MHASNRSNWAGVAASLSLLRSAAVTGAEVDDQLRYAVTDLGTLGGQWSFASAVNERGDIAGWSTLPGDGVERPFLWREGVMTDLGTLGGKNSAGFPHINDRGDVSGTSQIARPD